MYERTGREKEIEEPSTFSVSQSMPQSATFAAISRYVSRAHSAKHEEQICVVVHGVLMAVRSKSKVYEAVPPLTSTSSSTTPSSTARARAPHNSHNKSPRTTDARSTYKGITDQKEDRRVREGVERQSGQRGEGEGIRNNGSTQIAKPPLLRKALLLHLKRENGRIGEFCGKSMKRGFLAKIIYRKIIKSVDFAQHFFIVRRESGLVSLAFRRKQANYISSRQTSSCWCIYRKLIALKKKIRKRKKIRRSGRIPSEFLAPYSITAARPCLRSHVSNILQH